ncbi:MAG: ABC transporter ATP-binding protein [Dehalococcoidia bacterium]
MTDVSQDRAIVPPSRGPAVEVVNVSRWYGNVVAVNDVSFSLDPGITGLLGPNGAGKSTILHIAAGLLRPSKGTVRIGGRPVWGNQAIYWDVGLVPDKETIYPFLTGYQFVLLSAKLYGLDDPAEAAHRAIQAVDMEGAQDRRVGGYSKGMKQRVKVAAAIVHEPRILLLDEPFNGTDPAHRLQLMDFLRRMAGEGRTIVFSSHILDEVERLAENVLVIVAGRLAASGDFHAIRRLMTDRPHTFTIRSSHDRRLAIALVADQSVLSVDLSDERLTVRTSQFSDFVRAAPRIARNEGITLQELVPTDESLESVFSYLVRR